MFKWMVMHYHPFKLLRDCSTSAPPLSYAVAMSLYQIRFVSNWSSPQDPFDKLVWWNQLTLQLDSWHLKCEWNNVSTVQSQTWFTHQHLVSLVPLDKINWSLDDRTPSCDCPWDYQVPTRFYYTTKGRCMFPWQQDLQLSHIIIRKHHVPLHVLTHCNSHIKIKFCATVNACTYCTCWMHSISQYLNDDTAKWFNIHVVVFVSGLHCIRRVTFCLYSHWRRQPHGCWNISHYHSSFG